MQRWPSAGGGGSVPPLPRPSDVLAQGEVQQMREEVAQLEAQLEASERFRMTAEGREARSEAVITALREEMVRMASVRDEAEERARRSDDRVAGLLAQCRETDSWMSEVASRCEEQAGLNNNLQRELQRSQADCEKLRSELADALLREAGLTRSCDKAEAVAATVVPRLTDEAREHGRLAEQAVQTRKRLQIAETVFNSQAHDLQEEFAREREEKVALQRKCAENYQLAAMHASAGHQWQQRTRAAEQELLRIGIGHRDLWDVARRQRAEQWLHEEQLRDLEAERDRALADKQQAEQASKKLTGWVVSTLNEVNRTAAHARGDVHAPNAGHQWVNMLESFRHNTQTRTGAGNRAV